MRAVERLNVSLGDALAERIRRLAKSEGKGLAAVARQLIEEALARRERLNFEAKMVRDYAAGARDPEERALVAEATAAGDELAERD